MKFRSHLGLFAIDPRSFLVFRVALGLIVVIDCFLRILCLESHYTDQGIVPRLCRLQTTAASAWVWSFHFVSGSSVFNGILLLGLAAIGLMILLGKHTRFCCFIGWVMYVSLHMRIPGVNTGGDVILRLLLFWTSFIDARSRFPAPTSREPGATVIATMGTMGLMIQIILLYWVTAIVKSHPVWREQGTAIQWALGIESFQGPLAPHLLRYPEMMKILTMTTLWLEEAGPLLAILPFYFGMVRSLAVLSMMAFHLLGIGLTLRLGIFPWVCAIAWLIFLPPYFWQCLQRIPATNCIVDFLSRHLPPCESHEDSKYLRHSSNVIAGASMLYIFWWNLAATVPPAWGTWMPVPVKSVGYTLGLDQNWLLFAPRPATRDGWYVARAELSDGTVVDPLHDGMSVSFERPERGIAAEYADARTHRLLHGMFYTRQAHEVQSYADWIQRTWEKDHSMKFRHLEIFFMLTDPWHPEDGLRKVQVYPFLGADSKGRALFKGDLRWDAAELPQSNPSP